MTNSKIIYIPDKIELDEETKEFSTITTKNIYSKNEIIEGIDTYTIHDYKKEQKEYKKKNIIITTDLKLKTKTVYNLGDMIP